MAQTVDIDKVKGWVVVIISEDSKYRSWVITPNEGPVFRTKQAAMRAQGQYGGEIRQAELVVLPHA